MEYRSRIPSTYTHEGHSEVSFFFSLFLPAAPREILLLVACSTYVTLNKLQTRSQDVCNVVSRSRTASNIHFSPVLATGLFALVSTLTFLLRNKRVGARVCRTRERNVAAFTWEAMQRSNVCCQSARCNAIVLDPSVCWKVFRASVFIVGDTLAAEITTA